MLKLKFTNHVLYSMRKNWKSKFFRCSTSASRTRKIIPPPRLFCFRPAASFRVVIYVKSFSFRFFVRCLPSSSHRRDYYVIQLDGIARIWKLSLIPPCCFSRNQFLRACGEGGCTLHDARTVEGECSWIRAETGVTKVSLLLELRFETEL